MVGLMVEKFVCTKCKGDKWIIENEKLKLCPKCLGDGEVDWVSNVTGVKLSWGEKSRRICDALIEEGKRIHGIVSRTR